MQLDNCCEDNADKDTCCSSNQDNVSSQGQQSDIYYDADFFFSEDLDPQLKQLDLYDYDQEVFPRDERSGGGGGDGAGCKAWLDPYQHSSNSKSASSSNSQSGDPLSEIEENWLRYPPDKKVSKDNYPLDLESRAKSKGSNHPKQEEDHIENQKNSPEKDISQGESQQSLPLQNLPNCQLPLQDSQAPLDQQQLQKEENKDYHSCVFSESHSPSFDSENQNLITDVLLNHEQDTTIQEPGIEYQHDAQLPPVHNQPLPSHIPTHLSDPATSSSPSNMIPSQISCPTQASKSQPQSQQKIQQQQTQSEKECDKTQAEDGSQQQVVAEKENLNQDFDDCCSVQSEEILEEEPYIEVRSQVVLESPNSGPTLYGRIVQFLVLALVYHNMWLDNCCEDNADKDTCCSSNQDNVLSQGSQLDFDNDQDFFYSEDLQPQLKQIDLHDNDNVN